MKQTKKRLRQLIALCMVAFMLVSFSGLHAGAVDAEPFELKMRIDEEIGFLYVYGYTGVVPSELVLPIDEDFGTATVVSEGAFAGCRTLQTLVIPSGVYEIRENAFADCINLKTLTTANAAICENAFRNCTSLKEVNFTGYDSDLPWYGSEIGLEGLWAWEGNESLWHSEINWVHYDNVQNYYEHAMNMSQGSGIWMMTDLQPEDGYEIVWFYFGDEDCLRELDSSTEDGENWIGFSAENKGTEWLSGEKRDANGNVVEIERVQVTVLSPFRYFLRNLWENSFLYRIIEIIRGLFR